MEQEKLNEINEEVVNPVLEEVSKSNSNVLIKLIAGVMVVAAGVGGVILFRRHKKNNLKVVKTVVEENNVEVSEERTTNDETV